MCICFSARPGAPINLKPTKIGEDFIELEWQPPKNDGGSKITHYILKKKHKTSDKWEDVAKIDEYDRKYKLKNAEPNTDYYFAVFAENEAGISDSCESKKITLVKKPSKFHIQIALML